MLGRGPEQRSLAGRGNTSAAPRTGPGAGTERLSRNPSCPCQDCIFWFHYSGFCMEQENSCYVFCANVISTAFCVKFLPKESILYLGWESTPNFPCGRIHQGEADFRIKTTLISHRRTLITRGSTLVCVARTWWEGCVSQLALPCRLPVYCQKTQDDDITAIIFRMWNESPPCLRKLFSRQDVACWLGKPQVTFF